MTSAAVDLVALTSAERAAWLASEPTLLAARLRASGELVGDEADDVTAAILGPSFGGDPGAPGQHLWWVEEDRTRLGVLWLSVRDRGRSTNAAVITPPVPSGDLGPARCHDVVRRVYAEALGQGLVSLSWSVTGTDRVLETALDDAGFAPAATEMKLDLSSPESPADPGQDLELRPMTPARFTAYLNASIDAYAAQVQSSGLLPASDARSKAEEDFTRLLPAGLDTPGALLSTAHEPGEAREIGLLWVRLTERPEGSDGYLFDIVVDEALRGRGYGRRLMAALHRDLRARGAGSVGLNVFGHNQVARRLYDDLGYRVLSTTYACDLSPT